MKYFIFFSLTLSICFQSCRVPQKEKKEAEQIVGNKLKETVKDETISNQKPDLQLTISRDEKSKDSNASRKYFILRGNIITYGEEVSGRFKEKKPEKTVKLSDESLNKIKIRIKELGLDLKYEKLYSNKGNHFVKFGYFFEFEDNVINVSGYGEIEEDPQVSKIHQMIIYLENLLKE